MEECGWCCEGVVARLASVVGEVLKSRVGPTGLAGRAVTGETVYSVAKLVGSDLDGCLDGRVEGLVRKDVTIVVWRVELLDKVGECSWRWWGGR